MSVLGFTRKRISANRDYMTALENIFFNSDDCRIDYDKIDINSPSYDPEYEQKVRREEINCLYVLDEIMLTKNACDSEVLNNISYVENLLISYFTRASQPESEHKSQVAHTVEHLCKISSAALALSKQCLTESDYQNVRLQFSSIPLPNEKEIFYSVIASLIKKISAVFA